ncbi:LodA/GoxA family CTQ-dependent oxidase [Mesorhizobium sp. M1066]|uniref:LodA/GoxA family CTQ-dependent oxidase n=1 Tax=unclassified Mesorhizobium TaxID=325217 RepID=UPI00333D0E9C
MHDDANWRDAAFDSNNLASGLPEHQQARDSVGQPIRKTEKILVGYIASNPPGPPLKLRQWQIDLLAAWVDWNPGSIETTTQPTATITPQGLTRAALEGAVGQGFCPGIEAGIIITDPTLFFLPFDFRIDQDKAVAGETDGSHGATMAVGLLSMQYRVVAKSARGYCAAGRRFRQRQ